MPLTDIQIVGRIVYMFGDNDGFGLIIDDKTAAMIQQREKAMAAPLRKHYPVLDSCVSENNRILVHLTSMPLRRDIAEVLTKIPRTEIHVNGILEMQIHSNRDGIMFEFQVPYWGADLKYSQEFLEQAEAAEIVVPKLQ